MGSISPLPTTKIESILAKYHEERDKRLSDCAFKSIQTVLLQKRILGEFIIPLSSDRSPTGADTKVVIVGGGFAGLVTAVRLKEQGINDFVMIEKGEECGGTWY